jgi:endonuclease YncB( thermonuclease family)
MNTRLWLALMTCGALGLGGAAGAAPPKAAAPAKAVQGIVSQVTDGDTLWLRPPEGKPIEVRLRDIDAPEICQPWGEDARKALSELTLNKVASLQVVAHDKYGRAVGNLMIEDTNVSRFMVENGHAWSTRSRWDQGPLVKQEKMARALTRGLHSQAGAIQPWEWRRTRGACPK